MFLTLVLQPSPATMPKETKMSRTLSDLFTSQRDIPCQGSLVLDRRRIARAFRPEHQLYGVFNPSIHYRPESGDFLLLLRASTFTSCPDDIELPPPYHGVVYSAAVDEKGNVSEVALVNLPYETMRHCSGTLPQRNNGVEDPRAVAWRGEMWAVGNCNGDRSVHPCSPRMCLWKLRSPRDTFLHLIPPREISSTAHPQKNWAPFVWNDALYFEYSVNPRIILACDIATGDTKVVSKDVYPFPELSGGAAAVLLSERFSEREYFLNIAHRWDDASPELKSMKWGELRQYTRNYHHYFYLFEAHPPFGIVAVSHPFKLANDPERIQFAAGIAHTPRQNEIVVSYGKGDCDSALAFYSLPDVVAAMTPVTPIHPPQA